MIPVYTAADWNYRGPLWVMLGSLNNQMKDQKAEVFVLTLGQDAAKFGALNTSNFSNLRVTFSVINPSSIERLPIYGHVGVMTYARLLLQDKQLCPWDRILYLDADVLIRGSINELLDFVKKQTAMVGGVQECGTLTVSDEGGVFNWSALSLDPKQPYINAGVLGLRMNEIRRADIFGKCLEYMATAGASVVSWDQGAINAIAGSGVEFLPEYFNFTTSYTLLKNRRKFRRKLGREACQASEVRIAHFTGSGSAKPWHPNSSSPFAEEYRLFMNAGVSDVFPQANTRLEQRLGLALARFVRNVASKFSVIDAPRQ